MAAQIALNPPGSLAVGEAVGAWCALVDAELRRAPVQDREPFLARLPPMISPIRGASTSIATTVMPA